MKKIFVSIIAIVLMVVGIKPVSAAVTPEAFSDDYIQSMVNKIKKSCEETAEIDEAFSFFKDTEVETLPNNSGIKITSKFKEDTIETIYNLSNDKMTLEYKTTDSSINDVNIDKEFIRGIQQIMVFEVIAIDNGYEYEKAKRVVSLMNGKLSLDENGIEITEKEFEGTAGKDGFDLEYSVEIIDTYKIQKKIYLPEIPVLKASHKLVKITPTSIEIEINAENLNDEAVCEIWVTETDPEVTLDKGKNRGENNCNGRIVIDNLEPNKEYYFQLYNDYEGTYDEIFKYTTASEVIDLTNKTDNKKDTVSNPKTGIKDHILEYGLFVGTLITIISVLKKKRLFKQI